MKVVWDPFLQLTPERRDAGRAPAEGTNEPVEWMGRCELLS
jgi:hypothetical protein